MNEIEREKRKDGYNVKFSQVVVRKGQSVLTNSLYPNFLTLIKTPNI